MRTRWRIAPAVVLCLPDHFKCFSRCMRFFCHSPDIMAKTRHERSAPVIL